MLLALRLCRTFPWYLLLAAKANIGRQVLASMWYIIQVWSMAEGSLMDVVFLADEGIVYNSAVAGQCMMNSHQAIELPLPSCQSQYLTMSEWWVETQMRCPEGL